MTLRLIFSDNCKACKRAKKTLDTLKHNHPNLDIETNHINNFNNGRTSITPALFIDDILFSYGDIDKNRLLKKIGGK
mgnify:CR=1 FL=1